MVSEQTHDTNLAAVAFVRNEDLVVHNLLIALCLPEVVPVGYCE
jgi:hypothetical protein